jgi:small acid-soluble spore protein (thioredoxin-like protein)
LYEEQKSKSFELRKLSSSNAQPLNGRLRFSKKKNILVYFINSVANYICTNYTLGGIMMAYNNKPNPDDRSDNVEKLQAMIQNTENNIEAAEESLALADSETQRQQIEAKNERRRESIDSFRSEIKDEAHDH